MLKKSRLASKIKNFVTCKKLVFRAVSYLASKVSKNIFPENETIHKLQMIVIKPNIKQNSITRNV